MRATFAVVGFVACGFVATMVHSAYAEEKTFSHMVDCRKNDTGGCSADTTGCTTDIPADYIITSDIAEINSSMSWSLSDNGPKRTRCAPSLGKVIEFTATVQGGAIVKVKQPQQLCINAHVESGAGPDRLGDSFVLTCVTKFEIQEIKR